VTLARAALAAEFETPFLLSLGAALATYAAGAAAGRFRSLELGS
jgi:hypothetical protein